MRHRTSIPSLEHDDRSGLLVNSGESENIEIDGADLDLGALPPDEVAAEDFGMQRADEDADPPQRQAGRDQTLADLRHHLRTASAPTSRRRSASR